MSSGNNMQAGQISRLIEIAACTPAEAEHLLAACANNVEAAISLFFEQGAYNGDDNNPVATAEVGIVRAPIAPVREQLVGPEDDNFYRSASQPTRRLSRVSQQVKVCPLRDFAREGALMEEELQNNDLITSEPSSIRLRRQDRGSHMVAAAQPTDIFSRPGSSSRLGDLFRPPTDLLYTGSFQAARAVAVAKRKHWLLVNVQNDNFDSQLLNRDVWSDKEIKKLVRQQFIFWQVDTDSSEGRRFVAFYKCVKLPYVCIIDPRTGEEIWRSVEPRQINLLRDLQNFLQDHKNISGKPDVSEDVPSTSKRNITGTSNDDKCNLSKKHNCDQLPNKRSKLMELTEDEQIELAIKNSMSENCINANGNYKEVELADREGDLNQSTLSNVAKIQFDHGSFEEKLGSAQNELTALKLRLFNASGVDEVIQLHWPSDTLLHVLRLYITQKHSHIPKEGYKLISAFPRKLLEADQNTATLKELGLHPSANLHLTLDE